MSLDVSWNANKADYVQLARLPTSPKMCVSMTAIETTVLITGFVLDPHALRSLTNLPRTLRATDLKLRQKLAPGFDR